MLLPRPRLLVEGSSNGKAIMVAPTLWLSNPTALFDTTRSSDFVPVMAWVQDPETGKRRPSTKQAVTDDGMPIWEVKVIGTQDSYGRPDTAFFTLRVAARTRPERSLLAKIVVAE